MAFSEEQRVRLRQYLGYPDLFRQHNPRLESAFDTIGGRPDTQARAESIMDKIDEVADAKVESLLAFAGLARAEDVEWFQQMSGKFSGPQQAAAEYGRMLIGRLSIMFGVPIENDYFGTHGYAGDQFMGRGNQMSRRGGFIGLG